MRITKTYKQSEWLTEGPEESASLKADQAREVEDLKRRHEDEVESLKAKHERESDRQSKKDEAEAERDQQEDTLPDIEDSVYLQGLLEGKLVADDLMIIDVAIKDIKKQMVMTLQKNRESGVSFINSLFRTAGLKAKVSAKMQSKGRLFLKNDKEEQEIEERYSDVIRKRTQSQQKAHQKAMMKSAKKSIKDYDAKNKNKNEESEVEQDRDVKHKDGTQPKKYYKGLDKKTKDARDAHFKAKKSGPAPGDDDAKTKTSVHTKKYKQMFGEDVSQKQLNDLEKFADRILKKFGVDIEFTKHFADRMNDDRNDPAITVAELQRVFKKIAKNKAKSIRQNPDSEAVIKDLQMDLNLPVVIKYDRNKEEFEVVNKTIMRKKDFKTTSKTITTEKTLKDIFGSNHDR